MEDLVVTAGVWAYALIFVVTTAESSAFVGLFVPGEAVVLVAGALAERGALDPWAVGAIAIAGAVIGDTIGYWIGRRFGACRDAGVLARVWSCARMARAQAFAERHGAQAVFFGRFVGFARPLVPVLAGATKLDYRRFLVANAAGAVVWGAASTAAGFFAGRAARELADTIGLWASVAAVAVVAAAVVVAKVRARRLRRRPGGGTTRRAA